ncbi:hypothetical protein NKG94_02390 [Micromonospora sp. M12]
MAFTLARRSRWQHRTMVVGRSTGELLDRLAEAVAPERAVPVDGAVFVFPARARSGSAWAARCSCRRRCSPTGCASAPRRSRHSPTGHRWR